MRWLALFGSSGKHGWVDNVCNVHSGRRTLGIILKMTVEEQARKFVFDISTLSERVREHWAGQFACGL